MICDPNAHRFRLVGSDFLRFSSRVINLDANRSSRTRLGLRLSRFLDYKFKFVHCFRLVDPARRSLAERSFGLERSGASRESHVFKVPFSARATPRTLRFSLRNSIATRAQLIHTFPTVVVTLFIHQLREWDSPVIRSVQHSLRRERYSITETRPRFPPEDVCTIFTRPPRMEHLGFPKCGVADIR